MALSKTQSKRLATLLAVMAGEKLPEGIKNRAKEEQLINEATDGTLGLSSEGMDEKNRLCALAGLNIKYAFEKESPPKEATGGDTHEMH